MSKHTPGPWEIWTSCSYRRIGSASTGKEVASPVVQRSDGHPDIYFPNGGAEGPDALLIAAAPELFSALRMAVEAWDEEYGNAKRKPRWLELACAAIAKATKP